MSWTAQPHENSVQQKNYDTVDLTDDRDDSVGPSSAPHRLPADAPTTYPRHADSSSTRYAPPVNGHPTFPTSTSRAAPPPPPLQRNSPASISQRYAAPAAGHSFAASRQPLLDQSKVAPRGHRYPDASRLQQQQPPPFVPSHDQSSFNASVGSSLRLPSSTKFSFGPPHVNSFQSRTHAPAIAQPAPPVDRQHRAPSHPPPRASYPPAGQFAAHDPSTHHRQPHHPNPLRRQEQPRPPLPPQPIVRRDLSDDECAKSPPRKAVLPPGFAPPTSSRPGFINSFVPTALAPAVDQRQADSHVLVAAENSLDLVSPSPSPPHPHQHFGADPAMSRNAKGTPITPRDPSAGKPAVAVGGWSTGFDDDDDEGGAVGRGLSRQDKGKGRAAPSSRMAPAYHARGKGGERDKFQNMNFNKTAPSAVLSSNFHNSPHASTSSSRAGHTVAAAASSSSARAPRVIHQDDPQTALEMRGAAEKRKVEKELELKNKKKKPAASRATANGTAASRGRKKKEVAVVELSSSDDEDDDGDDDPIRTSDDDRAGSSHAPSHSRASTSSRPTLNVKGAAAAAAQAQAQQQKEQQRGSDSFSEDELAMDVAPRRAPHGPNVAAKVAVYHQKSDKAKPSVAGSLKPKTKPRVDGGPTDGGELDMFAASGKKAPRAAQASNDKGKTKAEIDNALFDQVKAVKLKAFFVGRKAVPPDYAHTDYTLLYNTRGKPKVTLRRKAPDAEPEDVCDWSQKEIERVSYHDGSEEHTMPFVEFYFKKDKAGNAVLNQLAAACELDDVSRVEPGERTIVVPVDRKDLPVKWESNPTTPTAQVLVLCLKDWRCTKASTGNAKGAKGTYDKALEEADVTARDIARRTSGHKGKGKQSQPKLSFPNAPVAAKAPRLHTDAAGDYVESEPPRGGEGGPPRRSSRPSTSAFAGDAQVAAAREALAKPRSVSPYGAEEIVLEYPMGEPGAVSVTWGDTKRLRDEEFLNDTLIEFGLKRIMKNIEERDRGVPDAAKLAPQIHVFNSFFYKQLSSKKDLKRGMDPYLLVEKWTKRVDLFSKRYIVVPINEYLHWYLAIIVNPAAILKPPPPAAAPRKSGRKRVGTVDSECAVDSPGGSPEVASKHFGGAGRSLREPDLEQDPVADEEDEEEQAARDKVARDFAALEQRKARDHDREVQAAVASVAAQSAANHDHEMDVDDGGHVASTSAVAGSSQYGTAVSPAGVIDDEDMLLESSQSPPPPPGQGNVHMRADDDMSEVDVDVVRARPEVEGGGPGKVDKHVVLSPSRSQGQHKRFADNDDDDDDIVVQEQPHERVAAAPAPASDESDASLESPDKLGQGKKRLRRGPKKDVVDAEPAPPPEVVKPLDRITLDDDEDESPSGPGDPAPTSAPMQKATSASSAVASTSGSSTSARTPATPAADTEPTSRSAPASTTFGSAASSSRTRQSVVAAPMAFTPQDPEPGRQEQLAREREEEEEARRRAKAAEEAELGEKVKASADKCWILTFDSLGAPHKQVANRVRDYLVREAASKRGLTETSPDEVKVLKVDVPQQPNSCDCGLYLLHFVETFFKNPQLYLDAALAAHLQPPPSKSKDKGKKDVGKKELESQSFDLWEGNVAQQKRAVMRAEVEQLSKAWQKDVEPLREKERLEREERKRLRAEEREEERNRKAAERAAALEVEEQQHDTHHRTAASSSAAATPARAVVEPPPEAAPPPPPPSAARSPTNSRLPRVAQPPPARAPPPPPPQPPSSSSSSKAKAKGKPSAPDLVLSDNESAPASSSHPVAEQASTIPTAKPRDEQASRGSSSALVQTQQQRSLHLVHQPVPDTGPSSSSSSKRPRASNDGSLELDRPAAPKPANLPSFLPPPPTPRVEPARVDADADSVETGVVDSQSLPHDEPVPSGCAGNEGERRPSKKVKVRHAPADSPQQPVPPSAGSSAGALVDYASTSDHEDGDARGTVADSQEGRAPPTPRAMPARRAATSADFHPASTTRSKTTPTETMVLEDD
ncbi:hypothetical protein JCM3775_002525 [Rhodotorula graminis]